MTDLRPDTRYRGMRDTGAAMDSPRAVDDLTDTVDLEPVTTPARPPQATARKEPVRPFRTVPAGEVAASARSRSRARCLPVTPS